MGHAARALALAVLAAAAPAAVFADDDPATIVSELTVTAKPKPTPLSGVDVTAKRNRSTTVSGVDVGPPKRCLAARSPPDRAVPAPKLVSAYPAKDQVVRPGFLVVRLTFDLPMACQGGLGAGFFSDNPCAIGRGRTQTWLLSYDRLTLRVLCIVKPKTRYSLWVDRHAVEDFKALGGRNPEPYELSFETSEDEPIATVKDAVFQDPALAAAAAKSPG